MSVALVGRLIGRRQHRARSMHAPCNPLTRAFHGRFSGTFPPRIFQAIHKGYSLTQQPARPLSCTNAQDSCSSLSPEASIGSRNDRAVCPCILAHRPPVKPKRVLPLRKMWQQEAIRIPLSGQRVGCDLVRIMPVCDAECVRAIPLRQGIRLTWNPFRQ